MHFTSQKNILGRYIRKRLGLHPTAFITDAHLASYGRDTITLELDYYCDFTGVYYCDFSVVQIKIIRETSLIRGKHKAIRYS